MNANEVSVAGCSRPGPLDLRGAQLLPVAMNETWLCWLINRFVNIHRFTWPRNYCEGVFGGSLGGYMMQCVACCWLTCLQFGSLGVITRLLSPETSSTLASVI